MLKETEKYLTDNFASKSNEIIKQQVQRIMKPEYQDIYFLKMELWESRLEELMNNKSTPLGTLRDFLVMCIIFSK